MIPSNRPLRFHAQRIRKRYGKTPGLRLSVALAASISFGAKQSPRTPQPAFTLTITAENETIKAGSNVKVAISLINRSQRNIISSRWVGGPDASFKIDVRDSQGKIASLSERQRAMLQGKDLPMGSTRHYSIGPGETVNEQVVVNEQYDLSAPDKYSIQAHRFDEVSKTDVKSTLVIVTVTP
jgi:hypothetical protein